jgi:glutamate mutase epsilon subunit
LRADLPSNETIDVFYIKRRFVQTLPPQHITQTRLSFESVGQNVHLPCQRKCEISVLDRKIHVLKNYYERAGNTEYFCSLTNSA